MATKKSTAPTKGAKTTTAIVPWDQKFAQYAKESKEQLKNVASGGVGIKFGRGNISVGGAQIPGGKLECIILGYCAMNAWNKDAYDPDNPQPPDCYAFSITYGDEEMRPHEKVPMPQATSCAECEKNQFGTAITGKGKACGNNERLGLLLSKDCEDAEDVGTAEIATAKVSPTNVKHFKAYTDMLINEHGRPPWAAITEISSYNDPKTQIRLEFKLVDLITDEATLTALEKRQESIQDTVQTPFQAAAERPKPVAKNAKFAGRGRR